MGLKQGPVAFLSGTHPRVSSSHRVPEAALAGLSICFPRTSKVLEKRVCCSDQGFCQLWNAQRISHRSSGEVFFLKGSLRVPEPWDWFLRVISEFWLGLMNLTVKPSCPGPGLHHTPSVVWN